MIEAQQVSRRFRAGKGREIDALRQVSMTIEPGCVCMLVGPNGSGKSTFLRILAGILRPSGGRATIAGHDVVDDSVAARSATGFLPERTGLPPRLPSLWHVALHGSLRGMRRPESLGRAGGLLTSMGIEASRHSPTAILSRGNRLKVALARALIHDPAVLLLDEPSAHLDAGTVSWLAETLRDRARAGTTILIATHDNALVERAGDRIVVLKDGRVLLREEVKR